MPDFVITSFNNGEVSPLIDVRSDIAKYEASCRVLENMLPVVEGAATRRPGTLYIGNGKNTPEPIRLIDFTYSASIAYMCEFGNGYIRFYYGQAPLLDGAGTPVEIASPYRAADLDALQYEQIGDTMRLTHEDYPPQILSRTSATTFTLEAIQFEGGPFLTRNDIAEDDDVTLTSSVTSVNASGYLTASSAMFLSGHAGSLFALTHTRESSSVSVNITGDGSSSSILIKGTAQIGTHGTWTATVLIERSEDRAETGSDLTATWDTYRTYIGKNDKNIAETITEEGDDIYFRITVDDWVSQSGGATADLTADSSLITGIVRIDAIVSTTVAAITVRDEVEAATATKRWAEGAWSYVRGFPRAIGFVGDRVVYAATTHQPQMLWFSEVDNYENFYEDVKDDDSFAIQLLTADTILWVKAIDVLAVGTSGGPWIVSTGKIGSPLTPTNYVARRQSTRESKAIQAVRANDCLLYVDGVGRKVRELTDNPVQIDKYVSQDLNAMAEHITLGGIDAIAFQKHPEQILWCIRHDGTLLSLTYERDQNVVAWARHWTGIVGEGETESTITYYSNPVAGYELTYVSENGTVYGIPVDWETGITLTLDQTGQARDVGAGLVGLPCRGHPFRAGQTVRVYGTSNYDDTWTLTSGTTDDELQFTGTYVAEVFDGTETVVQEIDTTAGLGRMEQDSAGTLYIGHNQSGGAAVLKVTDGLTEDTDFFEASPAFSGSTVMGVKLTFDGEYIYVLTDAPRLWKFNVADGTQEWGGVITVAGSTPYDMALDEAGNVYMEAADQVRKFNRGDGAQFDYTDITNGATQTMFAIKIDESMVFTEGKAGIIVTGGQQSATTSLGLSLFNLAVRDMDDTDGTQIALGGTYVDGPLTHTYSIHTGCLIIHNGFIYALVNGTLYKLTASLGITASVAAPEHATGIFADLWGHIVVINQDGTDSDVFHLYTENLAFVRTIGGYYTSMLNGWATYAAGHAAFWPGIYEHVAAYDTPITASSKGSFTSVAVIPGDGEDEVWVAALRQINGTLVRTIEVMAPRAVTDRTDYQFQDCGATYDGEATATISGLDYLEGETVAVLGDGATFPAAVVADGQITLAHAVSKASVGLASRYTLEPMRVDVSAQGGSTRSTERKIAELGISLMDSLDVTYGSSVDALQTIEWRTDEAYTTPPDLFTGDKIVTLDGGFDPECPIFISGEGPQPCTVRALIARVEYTGR